MITSTQITNNEIFAFIGATQFLSNWAVKFCLLTEKTIETVKKIGYFLRKYQISQANYYKIIDSWNAKFLGYFSNT